MRPLTHVRGDIALHRRWENGNPKLVLSLSGYRFFPYGEIGCFGFKFLLKLIPYGDIAYKTQTFDLF